MRNNIDIDTAKTQLKRINEALEEPHVIIGGLAIQQYYKPRNSKDIDLICDSKTARSLIDKLYPSKDYDVQENNDDEFRPSYEITNKINKHKIIFFGPKILEREPYESMDWEKLNIDSKPFKYKNEKFDKVRVPRIETLAFTKLLSFIGRIKKAKSKGEQDLIDFINLSNNTTFRINILIDHIRESNSGDYINNILFDLDHYDSTIWSTSLFMDFIQILSPIITKTNIVERIFENDFDKLFKVEHSVEFYDTIATKYDERNTNFLLDTHRKVIANINKKSSNAQKVNILDIGGGTGRLIAAHFFENKNIVWHCVEPSKQMASQFKKNMKTAQVESLIHDCSIFKLSKDVLDNKFDVIILSFVLSSLPINPDFGIFAKLLNDDGRLIIADSDPQLKNSRPFYDFDYQKQKVALITRMLSPLDIITECLKEKFILLAVDNLESINNEKYSFVMQFRKGDTTVKRS